MADMTGKSTNIHRLYSSNNTVQPATVCFANLVAAQIKLFTCHSRAKDWITCVFLMLYFINIIPQIIYKPPVS
jgi:hypothetical protein